ncbi:MAG: hypothetical protein QOD77_1859 [Thermoplasmata archaeon]|jgi:hypothetical protein|nr:hypothetical protein [Thermoplasmata archaeon]
MQLVLAAVASVVAAAPLALAFVVDRQVRSFQREAFGHLRRAARNLRFMAWAIFVYYLGVLAASWLTGDLEQLARWPLSAQAWAIYLRIGAAILAYVMAILVARELYLVTKPRPHAHETAREL